MPGTDDTVKKKRRRRRSSAGEASPLPIAGETIETMAFSTLIADPRFRFYYNLPEPVKAAYFKKLFAAGDPFVLSTGTNITVQQLFNDGMGAIPSNCVAVAISITAEGTGSSVFILQHP